MRGTRALLAAVIVMGVMILLGTAVVIGVVISRAIHRPQASSLVAAAAPPRVDRAAPAPPTVLDQPPGTRIISVTRQSDTLLAVTLGGGGGSDRLLIWDTATGHVVASLALNR